MDKCKNCQSPLIVKNGHVRGKQRFLCNKCHYTFVSGDGRVSENAKIKKALAVVLYSVGKASFRFLSKLFDADVSLVYRWIRKEGEKLPEPEISGEIREIEFDEMWHFIRSQKTKNGSSRPWIVSAGEPLPGLSAIVILRPSGGFMKK